MRDRFQEILRLTTDDSYSHAARMVSIRKEAELALKELDASESAKTVAKQEAAGATKARDYVPPKDQASAGAPAK